MGNFLAGIVSNLVERDFTKTPLTDEEIDVLIGQIPKDDVLQSLNQEDKKTIVNNYPVDVLIGQIPKDDVLDSLNQEDKKTIVNNYPVDGLVQRLGQPEREKIVKAMSDQKIFNLKGDNIFDYYVTNSKSELKNCMKGHMNKDGTICEDEKFKRMITTIPNLVMGPLGEKQSQWDTEKQGLQGNVAILEGEKQDLEGDIANLEGEKLQWNTDKQDLNDKVSGLEGEKLQWNTDKQDLNYKVSGLEGEKLQWGIDKQDLNDKVSGLEDDIDQWLIKENNWNETKQDLEGQKNSLQTNYDTLTEKNLGNLALDNFLKNPEMYNELLKQNLSSNFKNIFIQDEDINIDVKEFIENTLIAAKIADSYDTRESYFPTLIEDIKKIPLSDLSKFNSEKAIEIKGKGNLTIPYFMFYYLIMKIITQHNSTDKQIVPNSKIYEDYQEFFNELGIEQHQFEYALKFIAFNAFKKIMDYESSNDVKGLSFYLRDFLEVVNKYIGKEYINSSIVVPTIDIKPHELDFYSQSMFKGKQLTEYKEVNNDFENVMNVSKKECEDLSKLVYPNGEMKTKNVYGPKGCIQEMKWNKAIAALAPNPNATNLIWNEPIGGNKGITCKKYWKYNCIQKNPDFITKEECKKYSELINLPFVLNESQTSRPMGCYMRLSTNNEGVHFNENKNSTKECNFIQGEYPCIKKVRKEDYELYTTRLPKYTINNDKYIPEMTEVECNEASTAIGGKDVKWESFEFPVNNPLGCSYRPEKNKFYWNKKTDIGVLDTECSEKKICVNMKKGEEPYKAKYAHGFF